MYVHGFPDGRGGGVGVGVDVLSVEEEVVFRFKGFHINVFPAGGLKFVNILLKIFRSCS